MDPVAIAIHAGVIPATVLGLLMLAAAWITPAIRPRSAGGANAPAMPPPPATLAIPTLAWLLGFLIAAALIHIATWNRPTLWPRDATYRFLHAAAALSAWGFMESILALLVTRRGGGDPSSTTPGRALRAIATARWIGRAATVAGVLFIITHAYVGTIGWPTLAALVASAALLTLLSAHATSTAARHRHPALPWLSHFIAAAGAAGVLFLGGTATSAQASAGLAALAAATALAVLLARRAAPGPAAAFVWSGTLAWLLTAGIVSTGQTNIASAALLLAAPLAWLLPRRLDLDFFWKRVPLTLLVALSWSILCTAAAVALAATTQAAPPEPYEY